MSIVTSMTEVFTSVFNWIVTALESVLTVFYTAESGLTVLGVLAIVALAISLFFLVVGVISNFFHLRG